MDSASLGTTVLQPITLNRPSALPLVSILLANYNYAGYIAESIQSVLGQTYRNWELIVCDDGSTDHSVAVARRYVERDERMQLVRQQNGGHTSALNKAFSLCRGEIVMFLDSDDLFLPRKLESVVDAFVANPSAGMVVHRVVRVDADRKRQGVWPMAELADGWLGPEIVKSGGVLPYAPPTSGISLRHEVARLIFPISTEPPLHMCPDQVVIRLAPLLTAVKRLPGALCEYRVHAKNTFTSQEVSAPTVRKQLDLLRALWREQYSFLERIDRDAAGDLTSLDQSSFAAFLEYLEAKLTHSAAVRESHRRYLVLCKRQGDSKWLRIWQVSIFLPNFLFRPLVQLVTGQGIIKQFFARFRKLA